MLDFTKYIATRLKRRAMVVNSAGGYTWTVDQWTRLDRFLIFGSERGTYYIRERQLTRTPKTLVSAPSSPSAAISASSSSLHPWPIG
jgi:hypothetical protein